MKLDPALDATVLDLDDFMEALGCSRQAEAHEGIKSCTVEGHGEYHLYCVTAMDMWLETLLWPEIVARVQAARKFYSRK